MVKKIYVGNLPFNFTSEQLAELFQPFGAVRSATVMIDRETGKARGFGFVTMVDDEAAAKAISGLDGDSRTGRPLRVNEAREREAGPAAGSPRAAGGNPRPAPRRDDAAPRNATNFGPPAAPGGRRMGEPRREERAPERDWSRKPKPSPKTDGGDDWGPRHRKGGGGSRNWDDVDEE